MTDFHSKIALPSTTSGDGYQENLNQLHIQTLSFPLNPQLQKLPHLSDYLQNLPNFTNPLDHNHFYHSFNEFYISPSDVVLRQILFNISNTSPVSSASCTLLPLAYRHAGPRKQIFFNPSTVRAAIVTCGGLCPGMNTVVRELVMGLWELYGVRQIFGVMAGYRGFYSMEPIKLDPKLVHGWHMKGGTVLETFRGGFDLYKIVNAIESHGFNQVYIIGGDGTMRGAVAIFNEIRRRKLNVAVAGIPKTVDNDVGIIDRSFGFQTAVEKAQQAIHAPAHVEVESAVNGIGLVKLMGRSTGHIVLHATLSSRDVDCCLIPETDFYLEEKGGLFEFLEQRMKENGHAVLVVAEGAGQDLIPRTATQREEKDESGNPVFLDVGVWLKSELKQWWDRDHPGKLFTVKYIDPTYMIRAVPANATDNLYCTLLAHSAIHGVMAGYTGFVAGPINGIYAYIPVTEVANAKNVVDVNDHKWAWVRSVTNQPVFVKS
ncbi:LOW QUALITY PROTEIN: ATP-dependent 6-phosphofructokinase 2-like [Telopea speciosissima]|uniref:LOW QUALITY PROTEIN: ATP-dependent 6-phosphofructokinase 2-like n=1 Tax=Telopea speciosissima TaxID=54955 RepID=UPI001CC4AE0F|nr:LOW QUALITY PROTEIN: ATP-dependent 6-phosphofructokinase 2-like [Telopea speciosissima]